MMAGYLASARERVTEYLDAIDEHNEKTTLRYDDIVHQFNDHRLRCSDLRVLLKKLDDAEAILNSDIPVDEAAYNALMTLLEDG